MSTETTVQKPDKFYVALTDHEWKQLAISAKKSGKKTAGRLIISEMYRLEEELKQLVEGCDQPQQKIRNSYRIPQELRPFFKQLAQFYGSTVSVVLFRLIISRHLMPEARQKQE